ncbi:hypothetical protein [Cryobacterium sp. RHLT2-21]|uniref:Uncharacterized protein n=1 Tax=Cryobacterium mannosilyticum TaxID=1259190 RepID=A0A4V3IDG9_9MICO|nr:hypothetical protein E3O32_03540 [Cryobacterium mannosilyticum]
MPVAWTGADEALATSTGQADLVEQKRGFWVAGLGIFALWNLFTLVGARAGDSPVCPSWSQPSRPARP